MKDNMPLANCARLPDSDIFIDWEERSTCENII